MSVRAAQPVRSAIPLEQRFDAVRERSLALAAPLSAEDCCVQSMPDASPIKWHLAHTSWFFDVFVLELHERNFQPFRPEFRVLFNSYYNGVGDKHPRPRRGLLTRPSLDEVRAYREHVDTHLRSLLCAHGAGPRLGALVELGLHHEQQHQELMLTDVKHLLFMNPLHPAYHRARAGLDAVSGPLEWIGFDGGLVSIGHDGNGFGFDNELPRHQVYLQPYRLASRPVINKEYAQFVDQGGYAAPELWLSEGWDWVRSNALQHPLYWQRGDDAWAEFTLSGLRPLAPEQPVTHLSYFEADAYARWADARLPTEAEWEHASQHCLIEGQFADQGRLHPAAASGPGLRQMLGDVWEWTQSSYAPYPGFRHAEGAIGEYNGKFMVNQYVLRGGSCATPRDHIRASYRNFFPANARWQYSGLRLARDA
ncbi:MAG: ergothioneine biosynthesis protein EgtB [Burkholderiales bacterium]|nr:ergothioneine biosynthesis protein EgtB [Burkholderiales bacterium]